MATAPISVPTPDAHQGAPSPVPSSAPAPSQMHEPPPVPQPHAIVPPQLGFWQQPKMVDIVSFATSLGLHLAVLVIGFIGFRGYRAYQEISAQTVEQPIIPDAAMVEGGQVGGIPNPGLGGDPDRAAAQDQVKDVSSASDSWKQRRGDTITQSLMGDTAGEGAADSIIAPGLRSGRHRQSRHPRG